MDTSLEDYLASHANLLPEQPAKRGGKRLFPLRLPAFPEGREFAAAWLELPAGFPDKAEARILLSSEAVLRIPHIEQDGKLCIDGDPGPLSDAAPTDRIEQLLQAYQNQFFIPWCSGELDGDFAKEALNYWAIHCNRHASSMDAVTTIYTLDDHPAASRIYEARHLASGRIVIAGENRSLAERVIAAMGRNQQLTRVLIAEIPISYELTPHTWPHCQTELERLLNLRLGRQRARQFLSSTGRRGRSIHRIVILRAPRCSFGFLLAGGPATMVRRGHTVRAYPTRRMLPLPVERLDPAWTCGRDQHSEIVERQKKHVLVIGAGALGSSVIEQLTKAGVGHLSIVDPDKLSAANIGRHVLGADAIGYKKADVLARHISRLWPSSVIHPFPFSIQAWLVRHDLTGVDLVLDLTGEPNVRQCIELERQQHPRPLVIGWMEPYVAAAHVCLLPIGVPWLGNNAADRMESLQAIKWPDDVMQQEPACSSAFQSYTSVAATHAVALVTEGALALIDGKIDSPVIRSWVRGQKFLDAHYPQLILRPWAEAAIPFNGVSMERPWNE